MFNQGLNALVEVGKVSDQTFQQYILKALGELAVYVDGMNGLIQCNELIQWLYQLTDSKVREGKTRGEGKKGRLGGEGEEWGEREEGREKEEEERKRRRREKRKKEEEEGGDGGREEGGRRDDNRSA